MSREVRPTATDIAANAARAARWELSALSVTVTGAGSELPVVGGVQPYVHLEHAAGTPALAAVRRAVDRMLPFYGAGPGHGFKSELSSELYRRCQNAVTDFVGADRESDAVVFGPNTSDLVDWAARRIPFEGNDIVMVTGLEHESNELPWRRAARVVRVEPDAHGFLSEDAVEAGFRRYRGRVRLLAVTGASNVTGMMPDTSALADLSHRHGAKIFVDAAQLAGHRRIRTGWGDRKLDFVSLSGAKLYAPFGTSALVCPREIADRSEDELGEETSRSRFVGAIALAQACRVLAGSALDAVAERERALTRLLLAGLRRIKGVTLYGSSDFELGRDRVGIVPFNVLGLRHETVAEVLSMRFGIGVGSGSFGARPLVTRLLGYPELSFSRPTDGLEAPGMVRVSLGLSNDERDVEALCAAVSEIAEDPERARVGEAERLQRRSDIEAFSRDLFEA
jgi:selenocysteine lyase/cysteine desulfurase